jgi:hypothetical protein
MSLLSFRTPAQYIACHRCGNALASGEDECPHCGAKQSRALSVPNSLEFNNRGYMAVSSRMLVPYPSVPEEVDTARNIARARSKLIKRVAFRLATGAALAGALALAYGPGLRSPTVARLAARPEPVPAPPIDITKSLDGPDTANVDNVANVTDPGSATLAASAGTLSLVDNSPETQVPVSPTSAAQTSVNDAAQTLAAQSSAEQTPEAQTPITPNVQAPTPLVLAAQTPEKLAAPAVSLAEETPEKLVPPAVSRATQTPEKLAASSAALAGQTKEKQTPPAVVLAAQLPGTRTPDIHASKLPVPAAPSPENQKPQATALAPQTPAIQPPSEQVLAAQAPLAQILAAQAQLALALSAQPPMTQAFTTQSPATHELAAQPPLAQSPAAQPAVTQTLAAHAQSPATHGLAAQPPSAHAPAAQPAVTQTLAAHALSPSTHGLAAQQPSAQAPAAQSPATRALAAQPPATQTPTPAPIAIARSYAPTNIPSPTATADVAIGSHAPRPSTNTAKPVLPVVPPEVFAERPPVGSPDESLYFARLALITNDLSAARKNLAAVPAGRSKDEDVRQVRNDLARRESARDAAMQRARACDMTASWKCARHSAKQALAIDSSYSASRVFLRHVSVEVAQAKKAAEEAAVQMANAPVESAPAPSRSVIRSAPMHEATPVERSVETGVAAEPVPPNVGESHVRSTPAAHPAHEAHEPHDAPDIRDAREIREARIALDILEARDTRQPVRTESVAPPTPAPAPSADVEPIRPPGRGDAH